MWTSKFSPASEALLELEQPSDTEVQKGQVDDRGDGVRAAEKK